MEKTVAKPEKNAAAGGVAAVDKAITILPAFKTTDRALSLADVAARAGLQPPAVEG